MLSVAKRFLSGQRILPYDAQVEYIESDGNQYIDTGVIPNETIGAKMNFTIVKNTSDKVILMAGGDNAGWRWGFSSTGGLIQVSGINAPGLTWLNYGMQVGARHEVRFNWNNDYKCWLDGVLLREDIPHGTVSHEETIWVNASYNNGVSSPWRVNSMRIYSLKMVDAGVVIRDFIPVRVGSVGYLFDRITKKIYGSPLGAFSVGPDVKRVQSMRSLFVQDGISSFWDAQENVGEGIHLDQTTDWYDLEKWLVLPNRKMLDGTTAINGELGENKGSSVSGFSIGNFTLHTQVRFPDSRSWTQFALLGFGTAAFMVQGFTFTGDSVSSYFSVQYKKEYGSGGNVGNAVPFPTVVAGSEHVVDVAFDYASKTFWVYLDGVLAGESTIASENWTLDGQTLRIGTESYNGQLNYPSGFRQSDIIYYTRTLSAEEVMSNYMAELSRKTYGAFAYVRDGLYYIGEGIKASTSGYGNDIAFAQGMPTDDGWTVEVCGSCIGTTRQGIMLGYSSSSIPNSFGIGWWIANNNKTINFRNYNLEYSTGKTNEARTNLAYTIKGDKICVYTEGNLVTTLEKNPSMTVPAAIARIIGGSASGWDIDSIRVYRRALTAEEINANFRVDAMRFGLWSNPYVTDGLVDMWDAIENAGRGIHDETPNANWISLVDPNHSNKAIGNYTWTFGKNGARLIGTRAIVTPYSASGDVLYDLSSDFTICGCETLPQSPYMSNYNMHFGFITQNAARHMLGLMFKTDGYYVLYRQNISDTSPKSIALNLTNGQDASVSIVWHAATRTFDVYVGDKYIGTSVPISQSDWGGEWDSGRQYKELIQSQLNGYWNNEEYCGTYHNVRVYNRALSPLEIKHNYDVDTKRFGLWKNPYITKGLVAMWDGEWNAGPGVHNANATNWVDIIGGKIGSFHSAGVGSNYMYGGSFSFSNSDKDAIKNIFSTGNVTLENVVSFDSVDSYVTGWIAYDFNGAVFLTVNSKNISYHAFSNTWRTTKSISSYNGEICGCTIVGDGINGISYFNGELLYSEPFSVDPSSIGGQFQIGWDGSNVEKRRYHCIRLYNRPLTVEEIAYNNEIDKQRFN